MRMGQRGGWGDPFQLLDQINAFCYTVRLSGVLVRQNL